MAIDLQGPSLSLMGRMPAAPVRIRASAGEISSGAAKVFTSDPRRNGEVEQPNSRNGNRLTRYVLDTGYVGAVTVVESPSAQNGFRLVLRSESRRLSTIVIDWELLR